MFHISSNETCDILMYQVMFGDSSHVSCIMCMSSKLKVIFLCTNKTEGSRFVGDVPK